MQKRPLRRVLHDATYRLTRYFNSLPPDTEPYKLLRETLKDLHELRERGVGMEPVPVNTDILADLEKCRLAIIGILEAPVSGVPFKHADLGRKLWNDVLMRLNTIMAVIELEPISELKEKYPPIGLDLHDRIGKLRYFIGDWHRKIETTRVERSFPDQVTPRVTLGELKTFKQTLDDILDAMKPGEETVTLKQARAVNPAVDPRHTKRVIVALKHYFAAWKERFKAENYSTPEITFAEMCAFEEAVQYVLEGFEPVQTTATMEQAGPTIVLHEMELWEIRTNEENQPYLVDGHRHRHRAGIDPETDTYPLTMGRINYSVIFKDHWDAWLSDNQDKGFVSRDVVEKKVMAFWRDAMEQVGENPSHDEPRQPAFKAFLRFLDEVDEASNRMEALLVQDVPVFQRNVSTSVK